VSLPALLEGRLRVPVIGAPMFIVSGPELVIAQCKAGIVGSFPALNARPQPVLDEWLERITTELDEFAAANPDLPVAPYAVNQIVHQSNDRLRQDVESCVKYKVPIVITSLRPPAEVVEAIHSYGGLVFHDVISVRHARKAIGQGVDGIITVCAGAGGHAGMLSPFALVKEVREFYDGTIILSGAMSRGNDALAAQAIGADLAYIGTRFIATQEANAPADYKEPENLPEADKNTMNFGSGGSSKAKAWKDIWGAGQGVGSVDDIPAIDDLVKRMEQEYRAAQQRLAAG